MRERKRPLRKNVQKGGNSQFAKRIVYAQRKIEFIENSFPPIDLPFDLTRPL